MFYVIAIGIGAVITVFLGNALTAQTIYIPTDVEELLLAQRFYNSPDCFAYQDDIRDYIKVIDLTKFGDGFTTACFPTSNVKYAFSLSLDVPGLRMFPTTYNFGPINTNNWIESFSAKEKVEEVTIIDGFGDKYEAKLNIRINDVK